LLLPQDTKHYPQMLGILLMRLGVDEYASMKELKIPVLTCYQS